MQAVNNTITATANQSKRTFTLRTYDAQGKLTAKYRTTPMSREDFEIEEMNTQNDWANFLRSTDDYYAV